MHNGKGTWCYYYSRRIASENYEYFEEKIGDTWKL